MMQPEPVDLDWSGRWPSDTQLDDASPRLKIVDDLPDRACALVVVEDDRHEWHDSALEREALAELDRLERAVARGRERSAERARRRFLRAVQHDRVAAAHSVAQDLSLPLEPAGIGPVTNDAMIHRGSGRTWKIFPVDPAGRATLPPRASRVRACWRSAGAAFERYYLAQEFRGNTDVINGTASPCLIGVVAGEEDWGHWFILDRWTD